MTRSSKNIIAAAACLLLVFCAGATEPLKGPNCIPVKSLDEGKLAFKGGERLSFVIHYKWGGINSDVATATVKLDTTTLNGIPLQGFRKDSKVLRPVLQGQGGFPVLVYQGRRGCGKILQGFPGRRILFGEQI